VVSANVAVEGFDQRRVRRRPAIVDLDGERPERPTHLRLQPVRRRGDRLREHVEIAHRADRVREPPHLAASVVDDPRPEHRGEEAERGPHPPRGDPELVDGLDLARPRPRLLARETAEVEAEHGASGRTGGVVG
jgi:hypothetical protein